GASAEAAQLWSKLIIEKMSLDTNSPAANKPSSSQTDVAGALNTTTSANQQKLRKEIDRKLAWMNHYDDYVNKSKAVQFQPKGLVNTSNTCFMNVVVSTDFESLPASKYPTLSNLVHFNNDYFAQPSTPASGSTTGGGNSSSGNSGKQHNAVSTPAPINPRYFYDLVKSFNSKVSPSPKEASTMPVIPLSVPITKKKSKLIVYESQQQQQQQQSCQQDAQEFLIYFLDLIHEELVTLIRDIEGPKEEANIPNKEDLEGEWQVVVQRNKTSTINDQSSVATSPISQIFSGTLRSSVNRHESKESITLQPFYCLHLDIRPENVATLDDALSLFMKEETLEGYTCQTKKIEITASKSMSIEILPRILVVHFKRFAFDTKAQKLDKHVSFPTNLTLKSHTPVRTESTKRYSLFSVVGHHGKGLSQGHYTCDVLQPNNQWIKFDDANISEVTEQEVLSREAYLLLYQQQNTA
ncbi:hypothetical protein SAMD00019534_012540, partial [Acytostelium subglobosum LB1]|uniref:hypothetical protein n=1 Tax=Acytostelium subglobosum LB1 TaxID=1410327 RepID=UPI0006450B5B